MGWMKIENAKGRAAARGVTVALRVDSSGQKVCFVFGEDVVGALPGFVPGRMVDVWLGTGEEHGKAKLSPSNAGRKLQPAAKGAADRSSLALGAWDIRHDGALDRVECRWELVEGVLVVDLPKLLHPVQRASVSATAA